MGLFQRGLSIFQTLKTTKLFINGTEVTAAQLAITDPISVYSANALSKGDLVYISGYDSGSGKPAVTKADADYPAKAAMYVVAANIGAGAVGDVYSEGVVSGIDTSIVANAGDPVYLSATPGQFTQTAPTGADQICQVVGTVLVKNGLTGSVRFYPGKTYITARGASAIQNDSTTGDKVAPDDPVASTFILGPVEQNFGGSVNAVATKLTDSAPCKLEVLKVMATVTQAKAGGSTNDVTKLAKDSGGATAMTGDITCAMADTVYSNNVGSEVGAIGVGGSNAQVAKGDDIFIYTAAAASRSAGKYQVMAICKKIA